MDYHSPQEIIDFAVRFYRLLNLVVRSRMLRLGIPEEMIGIRGWPGIDEGAFVRFPGSQIGGNSNPHLRPGYPAGIALDHGIFDADHPDMAAVPSWMTACVRDRMDAAIVHEFVEATLRPPFRQRGEAAAHWLHGEAIRRAPEAELSITNAARRILEEYRQA